MPFVRIALKSSRLQKPSHGIADCVHRAMVKTIGIPEGDRFQIIREHEADLVYDPHYQTNRLRVGQNDPFGQGSQPGSATRWRMPTFCRNAAVALARPSADLHRRVRRDVGVRQVGYRSTRIQPSNRP
jgi:hypothetical protein